MNGLPGPGRRPLDLAVRAVRRPARLRGRHRQLFRAASRCSSSCATSTCPTASTPDVAPLFSPSGLVYRYVLQSPDRSPDGAQDDPGLGADRRRTRPCPASPTCRRSAAQTMQYQVLLDPTRARRRGPVGRRRSPRRWARTTATPAADSTPRAGSSTTCAAWAACRRPRTSATSSSRCKNGTPDPREGRRPGRHRVRAAARPVRVQRPERRRRRRRADAHRRAGADRAQGRRGEDARAQRARCCRRT